MAKNQLKILASHIKHPCDVSFIIRSYPWVEVGATPIPSFHHLLSILPKFLSA